MSPISIAEFRELVWDYYRAHRREMPWRDDPSPYKVVISEVMLQQTQVPRVLQKYPEFMAQFPDFQSLATAETASLLSAWQGLGYNRRALFLQRLARMVVDEYDGQLPRDPAELIKLPGIGAGTAGSIAAFAFDAPVVFIETNIRRVFIHHFFSDTEGVRDRDILVLVEAALDREHPREWYYALMDYGTHLAKTVVNPNRQSRHYVKQSAFAGSDRQLRGAIIRLHLAQQTLSAEEITKHFPTEAPERLARIVAQLTKEGFLAP